MPWTRLDGGEKERKGKEAECPPQRRLVPGCACLRLRASSFRHLPSSSSTIRSLFLPAQHRVFRTLSPANHLLPLLYCYLLPSQHSGAPWNPETVVPPLPINRELVSFYVTREPTALVPTPTPTPTHRDCPTPRRLQPSLLRDNYIYMI